MEPEVTISFRLRKDLDDLLTGKVKEFEEKTNMRIGKSNYIRRLIIQDMKDESFEKKK